MGGCGGLYPLSGCEDVAEDRKGRRGAGGHLQHRQLQPFPPDFDARHRPQMAGGRYCYRNVCPGDCRHEPGQEAVLPHLGST
ncbi:hypothetical protein D3C81_1590620 [compost metagenome]